MRARHGGRGQRLGSDAESADLDKDEGVEEAEVELGAEGADGGPAVQSTAGEGGDEDDDRMTAARTASSESPTESTPLRGHEHRPAGRHHRRLVDASPSRLHSPGGAGHASPSSGSPGEQDIRPAADARTSNKTTRAGEGPKAAKPGPARSGAELDTAHDDGSATGLGQTLSGGWPGATPAPMGAGPGMGLGLGLGPMPPPHALQSMMATRALFECQSQREIEMRLRAALFGPLAMAGAQPPPQGPTGLPIPSAAAPLGPPAAAPSPLGPPGSQVSLQTSISNGSSIDAALAAVAAARQYGTHGGELEMGRRGTGPAPQPAVVGLSARDLLTGRMPRPQPRPWMLAQPQAAVPAAAPQAAGTGERASAPGAARAALAAGALTAAAAAGAAAAPRVPSAAAAHLAAVPEQQEGVEGMSEEAEARPPQTASGRASGSWGGDGDSHTEAQPAQQGEASADVHAASSSSAPAVATAGDGRAADAGAGGELAEAPGAAGAVETSVAGEELSPVGPADAVEVAADPPVAPASGPPVAAVAAPAALAAALAAVASRSALARRSTGKAASGNVTPRRVTGTAPAVEPAGGTTTAGVLAALGLEPEASPDTQLAAAGPPPAASSARALHAAATAAAVGAAAGTTTAATAAGSADRPHEPPSRTSQAGSQQPGEVYVLPATIHPRMLRQLRGLPGGPEPVSPRVTTSPKAQLSNKLFAMLSLDHEGADGPAAAAAMATAGPAGSAAAAVAAAVGSRPSSGGPSAAAVTAPPMAGAAESATSVSGLSAFSRGSLAAADGGLAAPQRQLSKPALLAAVGANSSLWRLRTSGGGVSSSGGAPTSATASVAAALAGLPPPSEEASGSQLTSAPPDTASSRVLAPHIECAAEAVEEERGDLEPPAMTPQQWPASGAAAGGPLATSVAERLMTMNPLYRSPNPSAGGACGSELATPRS
ncbi:hypothetical protein HYH03_004795 [Edaphochlamys debaryana]|uniref:Uncharacterized protein n=1 Tax=Edaphochlamys debaryana TaxID=47281 RepID=A0A835Y700_9CHLO|nr:hypothetical protein HYH03_004795 [Edaphochlamys debaryana]|eukprot:KAG2497206.1 hypothetical protein HYH03_004795 [Edaphochlamys debaryana]